MNKKILFLSLTIVVFIIMITVNNYIFDLNGPGENSFSWLALTVIFLLPSTLTLVGFFAQDKALIGFWIAVLVLMIWCFALPLNYALFIDEPLKIGVPAVVWNLPLGMIFLYLLHRWIVIQGEESK